MAKKKMTLEEKLEEAIVKDVPYEVPENWGWIKFGTVCKLSNGYAFKSTKYRENGVPILRISNIQEFGINFDEKTVYSDYDETLNRYYVDKGDLLIAMSGATTGKTGVYNEDKKAYLNQRVGNIKIEQPELITEKFRNYIISYKEKEILDLAYGGAQPNISTSMIEGLSIPLPPLKEQQRIVDKIESLFEKLDKAKELIEEARDDFEKRKSAILEKAFRGELTKEWRKRNNTNNCYEVLVAEIDSRNKKYSKVKKNEKPNFMNYGEPDIIVNDSLPSSWIKCPIGLICDCIVPGRDKPRSFTGDIPWITIPNITSNYIDKNSTNLALSELEVQEVNAKIIPVNSVIMSCVGRFGISSITTEICVINQQLHAFLPSDLINSKFLMYHIRILKGYMESIATSTTIAYINKSGCNSIPINLPPIEEQNEIVRILDKILGDESRVEELTELEEKIELIKKSILAKAFRGQLGTNCEEDESALELLKEILSKE